MKRALLALPIALAACDMPARDNGFDPLNAPVADLEFFDASPYACDVALVGTAVESVLVLDRGRCLGLSALESTDPQQGRPGRYRFLRVDGATETDLSNGFGSSPVVVLNESEVRALPSTTTLRFRLAVLDSAGTEVVTEREIQIANAVPELPHLSTMTIPFGGFPWMTPGTTTADVVFDSPAALDPNGDPIGKYVWTFPDGVVESPDPLSPAFVHTVDVTDYRPYVATLRVEDDAGLSTGTGTVVVNRRPANIWLESVAGFARVDPLRQHVYFNVASPFRMTSRYFEPAGMAPRTLVFYDRGADRVADVLTWPTLAPAILGGSLLNSSDSSGIALSPAGDQVVVVDANSTTAKVHRFPYDGTSVGAAVTTSFPAPDGNSPMVEHTLGAIWVSFFAENLYAVDAATGALVDTFTDTLRFRGLAVRPGNGELWMARSADRLDVTPVENARLNRFTSTGAPQVIETGSPHVFWLTWADQNDLWVVLDQETVLVDVAALESGSTFESSIVLRVPTSEDTLYALTDLSSGDAVLQGLSGQPVRIRRDGTVRIASVPFFMEYFDRQGGVWSSSQTGLDRASPDGGVSPATPFYAEGGGGPDGQGGLWVAGGSLFGPHSRILRISEDGTLARDEDTWIVDGVEREIPSLAFFRPQPGTRIAWGHAVQPLVQSLGIYRIDLSRSPPVATLVLDSTLGAQMKQPVMEPSSPASATPFTWMLQGNTTRTVVQVSDSGQVTAAASALPDLANTIYRGARSVASNGLCLSGMQNTLAAGANESFRLRWYPPTSPPTVFTQATISVPENSFAGPAAVSRPANGTGDVCWYSYQQPLTVPSNPCSFGATTIIAFNAGTTTQVLAHTPGRPGVIEGLRPVDTNRFWILMRRCNALGEESHEMELVTRAVTGALVPAATVLVEDSKNFVDWESSPNDSFLLP